jgi:arylformamidase
MLAGWALLSQAARDAAYNNNLAVANSAVLVERRNAASAAFRAAHPAGLDVPYGPAPRQRFDLFPGSSPAAPCLVFIHGGYWQRNTREDFACFSEGANKSWCSPTGARPVRVRPVAGRPVASVA